MMRLFTLAIALPLIASLGSSISYSQEPVEIDPGPSRAGQPSEYVDIVPRLMRHTISFEHPKNGKVEIEFSGMGSPAAMYEIHMTSRSGERVKDFAQYYFQGDQMCLGIPQKFKGVAGCGNVYLLDQTHMQWEYPMMVGLDIVIE